MKKFAITIKGESYTPKLSMRALRLFKDAAGYDLLTSGESFDSYDVIIFLWACVTCGALTAGKTFDMSPEEFENEIHPSKVKEISEWFSSQLRSIGDPEEATGEEATGEEAAAESKKKKE